MTNGKLNNTWNATCLARLTSKSRLSECGDLHTLGIYNDVLILEYAFKDASLYDFGKPVILHKGGRAKVILDDFQTDVEQKRGELTLIHNCRPLPHRELVARQRKFRGQIAAMRRADTTVVSLRLRISRTQYINFGWQKVCGHGRHHALDYGVVLRGGSVRSLRDVNDGTKIVIGPDGTSTRVYLRTERGAGAPRFQRPVVDVAPDIDADPNSNADTDTDASIDAVVRAWETRPVGAGFVVLYECGGPGRAIVTAKIPLPPFDNVTMAWTKDCGGGPEPSLSISVAAGLPNGVVAEAGIVHRKYRPDVAPSDANIAVHDAETIQFHIVTSPNVHIGAPSVDAIDTGVVRVRLRGSAGGYTKNVNGKRNLIIDLHCRHIGQSRIRVAIPVQDRAPTEWLFFKHCVGAQEAPPVHQGLFFASGIMLAVVFLLSRVVYAMPRKDGIRKVVRFQREVRDE